MYRWADEAGLVEERLHDQADLAARPPGETKRDADAAPMQHSREMLPDPDETLRYLFREARLDPDSSLADLKRDWARTATAVRRSRDAGVQHSRKRAREDQDERGTRPEAWLTSRRSPGGRPTTWNTCPSTGSSSWAKENTSSSSSSNASGSRASASASVTARSARLSSRRTWMNCRPRSTRSLRRGMSNPGTSLW